MEDIRTALIVDSNANNRLLVAEQLSDVRMKSFFAGDCEEAIGKLQEFTPSLLVIDLTNPDTHADELIETLGEKTRRWGKIPIVFVSETPDIDGEIARLRDRSSIISVKEAQSRHMIIAAMTAVTKSHRLSLEEDNEVRAQVAQADVETILIVEDMPDNMELFRWILDGESLNYEGVTDGQSAIDAANNRKYDLILMDINLPDMSGKDVTRAIREMPDYIDTPIIAVTAHAIKSEIEGIMSSGITALVTKPINQAELISVINKHLSG